MGREKIAITSASQGGLDDLVAQSFGRCKTFTIVELEGSRIVKVEAIENPAVSVGHGAGPLAAQTLANKGVSKVVVTRLGPRAEAALRSLGIEVVYVEPEITVREALRKLGVKA